MTEPRVAEAYTPDPFRVEIKQTAKGDAQVSVRATAETSEEAVEVAIRMYHETLKGLSPE